MEKWRAICVCLARARHNEVEIFGVAAQGRVIKQVPKAPGANGFNKMDLHLLSVSSSPLYASMQCSLALPPPLHWNRSHQGPQCLCTLPLFLSVIWHSCSLPPPWKLPWVPRHHQLLGFASFHNDCFSSSSLDSVGTQRSILDPLLFTALSSRWSHAVLGL